MDSQHVVDLGREAIWMALLMGGPVLLAGMLVGLVIGLLQALTQVQEQSVSFVPKLLAMFLTVSLLLPWLLARMMEYCRELISSIPEHLSPL
ncbi:MAG TPA: flagellar biosynthesis protein FliQ [Thermoguttaceae bacterium]|nr:flagellar biosynthesis protein FliQ [Thermoguttaceae bacterium]